MFSFFWDNQKFNVIQYGKGVYHNDMTRHAHSASSYELHYIESGNGELITDNGAFKVSKGDFFITGPNIYHKQNTDKNNNLEEIHIYAVGRKASRWRHIGNFVFKPVCAFSL